MCFRSLSAIMVVLLSALSAAAAVANETTESSGFIDPAIEPELSAKKLPDGREFQHWRSPQTTPENYQSIMVDRVIFYPAPHPGPQISSSTLESIADYLTRTLRQKVGAKVTLVDKAGPGVLRLQAAITSVTVKEEGINKPTDVLPVMLVFSAASSAAGTKDEDVTAVLELRATDSVSGEYRAAGVMKLEGEQLEGRKDELQLKDMQHVLDQAAGDSAHVIENSLDQE